MGSFSSAPSSSDHLLGLSFGAVDSLSTSLLTVGVLYLEFPVRAKRIIGSMRICLMARPGPMVRCHKKRKVPRSLRTEQRRQEMARLPRKALFAAKQNYEKTPRVRPAQGY